MRHRTAYSLAALAFLLIEIVIAMFVRDSFVRPHLGDSLAVVLVYLMLRASTRLGVASSAASALLIACAIEVGQFYGLVDRLGLGHSAVARTVLGTGFDPRDFIAYAGGAAFVLLVELLRLRLSEAKAHRASAR